MFQKTAVQRTCWILVFLAVWQIAAQSGRVSALLLPGPKAVWHALLDGFLSGQLFEQIGFSLAVIGIGMLIGLLLSFLFAALSLRLRLLSSLFDTLCVLAHPLPAIALLPLIIVWFGVGRGAVTAAIVHSVLWPVLVNMTAGLRAVPPIYKETGRNLCLSPLQMLWHIHLPASASYILSGMRIGWARAWRALISAEMIFGAASGSGGIGWFIFKSRVLMNPPGLFAGVIVVVVIGIAAEGLLNLLEKKTIARWKTAGAA